MQSFASAPQAVGTRKQKYRDPDDTMAGSNMMHDRRIMRGNTYGSTTEPSKGPDGADVTKQRDAQRRRLAKANKTSSKRGISTPEPLAGRKHMDIQTDSYLEKLTERTVEFEAETQTDFLLDRPPSPLFMPAKIGIDIDTQIEDGELFDFDVECEPVLEVLVGKTLEQGMMEVLEEEELESLRRHQEEFEKRRNKELLEVQRMEAAEKRREDESSRRNEQTTAKRELDISTMRKVVARSMAATHLASIKDRTLAKLQDAGVFTGCNSAAVDAIFLPNLLKDVFSKVESQLENKRVLQGIMQDRMTGKLTSHDEALEKERQRLNIIDDAEREARAEVVENRRLAEQEQSRQEAEKKALAEWEAYQPPEPEVDEVQLVKFLDDGNVVTTDGRELQPVEGTDREALKGMLEGLPPGGEEVVVANVVSKWGGDQEDARFIDAFHLGPPLPDQAGKADAEAEAAGDAAP